MTGYGKGVCAEEGVELTEEDFPPVSLADYLENISLLSAVDMESGEDATNRIALMTVHSSKGLEFPYVYVAGMEENLFPSGGGLASESDIEEERRLFYVAVTRAEKAVSLSFATTRMRNGKSESNEPSRFIREIDRQYISNPLPVGRAESVSTSTPAFWGKKTHSSGNSGVTPFRRPHTAAPVRVPDSEFVPTPVLQLSAGQRVEHNRFGYGKILEITGSPADLKAKIVFDDFGEKILLLKYAKIRAVDVAE